MTATLPAATVVPAPEPAPSRELPSVGVVVPTRERPVLLRACLTAIVEQEYAGAIDVVVVFDGTDPDPQLVAEFAAPGRTVRVVTNTRGRGLAAARNTGLALLRTELAAFCDDDDTWAPGKLTAQVDRLQAEPTAELVTSAITVHYAGRASVRRAGRTRVEHADLLASRLAMLHSSTFLFRRTALEHGIGWPEESIPGSQNEDWDLLLRAAARHPVVHVDEPLVDVLWGQSSYFSRQWDSRVVSLHWMLERHPGIAGDRVGAARVYGQLAFGYAVLGRRRAALRWIARGVRTRWREPRAALALLVVAGVPGETVLSVLHRRGHGV